MLTMRQLASLEKQGGGGRWKKLRIAQNWGGKVYSNMKLKVYSKILRCGGEEELASLRQGGWTPLRNEEQQTTHR